MRGSDVAEHHRELRLRSADGTGIGYQRTGAGSALILVEAAGHFRGFSSFEALTEMLRDHFTIYSYDRRGRGESTDTAPYTVAREVEDLDAMIGRAGGSAFVYGFSRGALLALHAAASGLAINRLAVLEPPIGDDAESPSQFTTDLVALAAANRRGDTVEYFNSSIGVPPEMLREMRDTPAWAAMESVAPTLVYDAVIGDESPPQMLADVKVRTLVLDSKDSTDDLTGMAATVARGLPDGVHMSLPGEWHGPREQDRCADRFLHRVRRRRGRGLTSPPGGAGRNRGCVRAQRHLLA
jgi:pimeloyl-ACP methyl ester carboxylesterase